MDQFDNKSAKKKRVGLIAEAGPPPRAGSKVIDKVGKEQIFV